mmetsp:Transcript_45563/g.68748  ORF Transcript_45563/g.68748 Transcript_45563/m.68748 type:complete len:232 (+) Transcript_45563:84-779(+)
MVNRFLIKTISFFLLVTANLRFSTFASSSILPAKETPIRVEVEVQLTSTSTGKFMIEVHPEWSPLGAERFLELMKHEEFWEALRFYRVLSGSIVQFGIAGDTDFSSHWEHNVIKDDHPAKAQSNERGYISFASLGPDTRTTIMFINLADNSKIFDRMNYTPFGRVVEGMDNVVDQIYSGYGDAKPHGDGPNTSKIYGGGNKYLKRNFPKLSYVKSVEILDGHFEWAQEDEF